MDDHPIRRPANDDCAGDEWVSYCDSAFYVSLQVVVFDGSSCQFLFLPYLQSNQSVYPTIKPEKEIMTHSHYSTCRCLGGTVRSFFSLQKLTVHYFGRLLLDTLVFGLTLYRAHADKAVMSLVPGSLIERMMRDGASNSLPTTD